VMPELKGKLDGTAIRIPTPNVSLVSLDVNLSKPATKEDINAAMQDAAKGALAGILDYNKVPLVSIDFNHNPASCTFDATQTADLMLAFVQAIPYEIPDDPFGLKPSPSVMAERSGDCDSKSLLLYLMLLLTSVSQFGISSKMAGLRSMMGDIDSVSASDPLRMQFNSLHVWSTRLEGGVLLLGLVVVYLNSRSS